MLRIDAETRPWWTLAGACSGLFLLMLDSTVVALALPSIRGDVGASTSYGMILVGYLLFGIALGLVYAPMSTAAMAATGAVFHALLGDGHSFADAVAGSTWVVAVLCGLGVGLTWAFVRDIKPPGPDPAVAGEPPVEQLQHHRHHHRFHL